MAVSDAEIDRLAREMIAQHGQHAVRAAIDRLNEMIDRNDLRGRDIWACVVHAIHERQGTGPVWSEDTPGWHEGAARFECAPLPHTAFP